MDSLVTARQSCLFFLHAAVACVLMPAAFAQSPEEDGAAREFLRQQERERELRQQQETRPDVRLDRPVASADKRRLPDETPCFPITDIRLEGEGSEQFQWALPASGSGGDPALGRCLGTAGINMVMSRIQDVIVARGYVTTRVLAAPQDLNTGALVLTVVPGRIRDIRISAQGRAPATLAKALPVRRGGILNLRDIEQGLENLQRVPSVTADIQIVPAEGSDAAPGYSDLVITWHQRRPLRVNLLVGCGWVEGTARSELSAYAEPTSADVAHIRLIGSRNVKVYPDSTCASHSVPGSGYPAGPQMGGQRRRDLGMPKLASTPAHYVEMAAKPIEPITVSFAVQSQRVIAPANPATGAPMLRQTSGCQGMRSFVPQAKGQYEVVLEGSSRNCWVTVYKLVEDDSHRGWTRETVESLPAAQCTADGAGAKQT